jgi:hypothetical protein
VTRHLLLIHNYVCQSILQFTSFQFISRAKLPPFASATAASLTSQFVQGAGCRGKGETYWSCSSFLLFLRENGVRTPSKNDFFDFFFSLPTVLALLALLALRDPSARVISSI